MTRSDARKRNDEDPKKDALCAIETWHRYVTIDGFVFGVNAVREGLGIPVRDS